MGGEITRKPFYARDVVSDFDISFKLNNEHQEKHTLYLLMSWENPTYDRRSSTEIRGGSNNGRLVYPVIRGLMIKYHIPGLTTTGRSVTPSSSDLLEVTHKER